MAALHFLLPTGDSRSGRRSFDSKLISLLPLDEVPVHAPLRRPRPLRFARLPVPVWNPYSRGRLGPAKSEDRKGGEGKADANLTIFFSTCCAYRAQPSKRAYACAEALRSATRCMVGCGRSCAAAPGAQSTSDGKRSWSR